jgi:hypothetical protein
MSLGGNIARLPLLGPSLIDAARLLRYPEIERVVRIDIAGTRRSLAWLRNAGAADDAADGRTLLILSLTDMIYQLKLEAMLASALRLRGWRVRILTGSPANLRARRYFEAFGLDEFVYLDNYQATRDEMRYCADAAQTFMRDAETFTAVKRWTFEDAWIGPQVLSAVSRASHQAAPNPADPETRAAIAAMLPQLLCRTVIARRLIADIQPDLGLVIEANDSVYGPFVDRLIGSGTNLIQVTQPWRDDALTLRRLTGTTRRMHPSSVASETLNKLAARPWSQAEQHVIDTMFADRYGGKWFLQSRNQPDTQPINRSSLIERLGLNPDHKIAVVFSHVLWDANLFYGEDLFLDYGDWFIATVAAAAANPSVNWIIKLHPANLWKRARENVDGEYAESRLIREHIGTLPPHVHLLKPDSDINSLSLFEHADIGITVRGTSGMEMPCFGKPTLTAGTGRYSNLGFTIDSAGKEEYLARLATLHELAPMDDRQIQLALWHAYAAFVLRPWRMRSFKSCFDYRKRGHHPLDQNMICLVSRMTEVEVNGDLYRFAEWAGSDAVDYLEIDEVASGNEG